VRNKLELRAVVARCWKGDNARLVTRTSLVGRVDRFESVRAVRTSAETAPGQGAPAVDQEDLCWVEGAA